MNKIIIEKCIRCGKQHEFNIKNEGLQNGICINLACPNIQRYVKLTGFHFSGEANILESDNNKINDNLINRFGSLNLDIKKEKIKNIGSYILVIDEYTNYLNEIYDSYIMGYTYPFVISICTLLERILNVMILKLKSYHIETEDFNKIYCYIESNKKYNNNSDSISNWEIMINSLYNWGYLDIKQKKMYNKFKYYRNEVVHFNKNYDFKSKEDDILSKFNYLIKSLFGIFERIDIVGGKVPGEFWIKPSLMNNPFVKEFFIPNGNLFSYNGNIFGKIYSEEGTLPGFLNENDFFDLRIKNLGNIKNPNLQIDKINLYGFNLNYRII